MNKPTLVIVSVKEAKMMAQPETCEFCKKWIAKAKKEKKSVLVNTSTWDAIGVADSIN